jgi:uncharacterized protein YkwD
MRVASGIGLSFAALTIAFAAGAATTERTHRARYLSAFEREVLAEQNLARTHPKEYAEYVEEWLQYYHGTMRHLPHRPYIRTIEGKRAVVEAVEFLEAQKPLPPLRPEKGLSRAARDHVADTGPKGWTGHVGSDDSEPGDRVSRYGRWYTRVGENIAYGGSDARELVIRLIIDDGIPDRGHRRNIFNPEFRLAGVAFGPHADYGTMCVVTYAADFDEY